ncbi:hypothetical protein ACKC9G_08405 [Pokkaliibacter sp. CJK22405]|uniref:hypothetical protein n=1 Tax=Pokkaliibacter sp. CJK22405 TaxID=3384615 RepID=UPI003984872B
MTTEKRETLYWTGLGAATLYGSFWSLPEVVIGLLGVLWLGTSLHYALRAPEGERNGVVIFFVSLCIGIGVFIAFGFTTYYGDPVLMSFIDSGLPDLLILVGARSWDYVIGMLVSALFAPIAFKTLRWWSVLPLCITPVFPVIIGGTHEAMVMTLTLGVDILLYGWVWRRYHGRKLPRASLQSA